MDLNKKWDNAYNLLVKYKEEYGDVEVSQSYVTEDGKKLGQWVHNQRLNYKKNNLSNGRIEKLKLLGFRFDNIDLDEEWNNMYNLLVKYKKEYGNIDVPIDYVTEDGVKLGIWFYLQWIAYKNNRLLIYKLEKLSSLGFKFFNIERTVNNVLLDFELIEKSCIIYNIDYIRYKMIFDKLSYNEFISRLYYVLDNYMSILDNNGNLNIIFYMNNDSLYLSTGYTNKELVLYYTGENRINSKKIRKI